MTGLPRDPDDEQRTSVERQGNVMFWITLTCGALVVVIALIYAVIL